MKNEDLKTRINKGIIFLRAFNNYYDVKLYHKSVLRFLDIVESYLNDELQHGESKESVRSTPAIDSYQIAKEIFEEETELQSKQNI